MAESLDELYARHRQGLFTAALSITRCPARAEDAVHEAFVRLCRPGGKGPEDALAYVYTAVRNAAIDQRRRAAAQATTMAAGSIFDGTCGAAADRAALDAEERDAVAAAVDELPDEQREAVVLRVYGQLSFAQIAAVVDAPLQTVASRYRRGLERLRQRLGGSYER